MAIVLAGITVISLNVLGQTTKSERQALLDQAEAASDAGDHLRALSLATRAGEIQMTPSLRYFIAEEQHALGQLIDSMKSAELCTREATEAKALQRRSQILRACKDLIAELQRSAARVIISMPDFVPPRTEVAVSGQVVPESLYGLPYLFSSGEIRVEVKAPGFRTFQRDLVVGPGQEVTVKVALSPAPDVVPVQPPEGQETKALSEAKETKTAPEATVVSAEPPKRTGSVGPYVVIGGGAASLGASAIFVIARNNAVNDLKALCGGTTCPDRSDTRSLHSKASTYNTLANVALGVGCAALVGGAIWLFYDRKHGSGTSHTAELRLTPTGEGAVVGIEGTL
jgi:hypothetical protein